MLVEVGEESRWLRAKKGKSPWKAGKKFDVESPSRKIESRYCN